MSPLKYSFSVLPLTNKHSGATAAAIQAAEIQHMLYKRFVDVTCESTIS